LDECEWGHSHEQIERVKFQSTATARLDEVGDYGFESCEECAEKSQD
jgi:hypothetical protein